MSDRARFFRGAAQQCREVASTMMYPEVRSELLAIARKYEELARHAEISQARASALIGPDPMGIAVEILQRLNGAPRGR
jgi:hypothetical protein